MALAVGAAVPIYAAHDVCAVDLQPASGSLSRFTGRLAASEIVKAISHSRPVHVQDAVVHGTLNLSHANPVRKHAGDSDYLALAPRLVFERVRFTGPVTSGNSPLLLGSKLRFVESRFESTVLFESAVFLEGLDLTSSRFDTDVSLSGSTFCGDLRMEGIVAGADLNGSDGGVQGSFLLEEISARRKLLAPNSRFYIPLNLSRSEMSGIVDFRRAHILGPFDMTAVAFAASFDLTYAQIARLNARDATFDGSASFDQVRMVKGSIDLAGAVAAQDVSFRGAILDGSINLRHAQVRGTLNFDRAVTAGLQQLEVSDETRIERVRLEWGNWARPTWFWLPLSSPSRTPVDVGKGRNTRTAVASFLMSVEKGLASDGDVASANEVKYRRRLLEREGKPAPVRLWERFVDLVFGYNLRTTRPFWLGLALVAIFAFYYWRAGFYSKAATDWKWSMTDFPVKPVPSTAGYSPLTLAGAFCLSGRLMTKLGGGTEYAVMAGSSRWVALVEWLVGFVLVASLLICFAGNYPDFGRLLDRLVG
jgi:hypothetical protein